MDTKFNKELDQLGIKYCFNEQKYNYSDLKFIIVGDNPGNTEFHENKFFIGPSGQELRKHFYTNKLIDDFDKECIIFNKTFIHTSKTEALKPIKNEIGQVLFDNIQRYCAKQIAELSNRLKLPILIFGKSNLGPNLLFDAFWKSTIELVKDGQYVLVFNHPSPPYLQFNKEWDKYKAILNYTSNLDLLKQIGAANCELIKNKYQKTNNMKTRFFYGAETHNTWSKLFVLSEDGKFYCEFLDYMKPAQVRLTFDFAKFKATDYKWGGYQSIVEIDETAAKNKSLEKQTNWISSYLDSLK